MVFIANYKVAGILHGVNIVSCNSKNGVYYSPEVLKAAAPLYEGAPVFWQHIDKAEVRKGRPDKDACGYIKNVQYFEGFGLIGDLHFFWNIAHYISVLPGSSERREIGLSHVVEAGFFEDKDGKREVQEIKKVFSVDLVFYPASARPIVTFTGENFF